MKPYYDHDGITIYHGDCLEIAPTLAGVDCIVSDPPYGMNWRPEGLRGGKGSGREGLTSVNPGAPVVGDDDPFDPAPWLGYAQVILFGANHFAQRLPVGTTLVWIKHSDKGFGSFLSDAEVAWEKGGHGVYCHRNLGMQNRNGRLHTSQKPIGLMEWATARTEGTVIDPFMGSGTTLVAAKNLGRRAIGIEIEERYCEIAAKRLAQGVLPL